MVEKEIGKINKGEYQGTVTDILVAIREYNGRVGVDIREYTKSEAYTGPTKKGLRIPADKFEEFKTMINSINPEDLKTEGQATAPTEQTALPATTQPAEDSGVAADGSM